MPKIKSKHKKPLNRIPINDVEAIRLIERESKKTGDSKARVARDAIIKHFSSQGSPAGPQDSPLAPALTAS